jgi:protein-arginine kinase activator protein McsA
MSRDRIQELVEVRANIAKIDEELKDVIAKNYEQKAFLRAGLQ